MKTHFKTIIISDVHLGTSGSKAKQVTNFLKQHRCDKLILNGDIIDGWQLKKYGAWKRKHTRFFKTVLKMMEDHDTQVIYLRGNHDDFLRDDLGTSFGVVDVVDRTVHITAQGKSYLVIHGDQFDVVVAHAKWLAYVGDWAYRFALRINIWLNWVRRRLGFPYWSLSAWAKHKVKNAVSVIGRFERALTQEAKDSDVDGVICGHSHFADIHDRFGIKYVNTGDWVESCTAIAETLEGELEVVRWQGLVVERPRRLRRRRTKKRKGIEAEPSA